MSRRYTLADVALLKTEGLSATLPPPPKKRDNEESRIQQNVIRWWGANCGAFGVPVHLLMSIPNGGRRDAITGSFLKKEGLRAGAPDLLLTVPRGRFHAAFIEMKTPKGYVAGPQKIMLRDLESQGYYTAICRSFEDARTVITEYLRQ